MNIDIDIDICIQVYSYITSATRSQHDSEVSRGHC